MSNNFNRKCIHYNDYKDTIFEIFFLMPLQKVKDFIPVEVNSCVVTACSIFANLTQLQRYVNFPSAIRFF